MYESTVLNLQCIRISMFMDLEMRYVDPRTSPSCMEHATSPRLFVLLFHIFVSYLSLSAKIHHLRLRIIRTLMVFSFIVRQPTLLKLIFTVREPNLFLRKQNKNILFFLLKDLA